MDLHLADAERALSRHAPRGRCFVCRKEGSACARCHVDFYCGKEHQRQDWARHKAGCGAVEVVGQYLVAAKDIPAGTRVRRELPVVVAPRPGPGVLCRGCAKTLHDDTEAQFKSDHAPWPQCDACGLPLCGKDCPLVELHRRECAELQRVNVNVKDQFGYMLRRLYYWQLGLMILRVNLWANENPDMVVKLNIRAIILMGSLDNKVRDDIKMALYILKSRMGLDLLAGGSEELKLAHILFLRFRTTLHQHGGECDDCVFKGLTALYVGRTLLEPSCLPNVFTGKLLQPRGDRQRMEEVLVTSVALRRGERLRLDHWGVRAYGVYESDLEKVRRSGVAVCRGCALCQDPTQLGVHLESWTCPACPGRSGLMPNVVKGSRQCMSCGKRVLAFDIENATMLLEDALVGIGGADNPAPHEAFLAENLRPRGALHPDHHIALDAEESVLCTAMTHIMRTETELNLDDLRRWENAGRHLLRVLQTLRPGYSHERANLLTPMLYVIFAKVTLLLEAGDTPKDTLKMALGEAWRFIEEIDVVLIAEVERVCLPVLREMYKDLVLAIDQPAVATVRIGKGDGEEDDEDDGEDDEDDEEEEYERPKLFFNIPPSTPGMGPSMIPFRFK